MRTDARILVSLSEMARQLRMSTEQLGGLVREGTLPAYEYVTPSGKRRCLLSPNEVERAIRPYLRDKNDNERGNG